MSYALIRYRDNPECVAVLLKSCVSVRKSFSTRFDSNQESGARQYSHLFDNPGNDSGANYQINHKEYPEKGSEKGLLAVSKSNAARIGKLFSGSTLIRVCVRFNNESSASRWSEECGKNNKHVPNHSPCLFTVQCSCTQAEFLGV